jgi:hypothetical protein
VRRPAEALLRRPYWKHAPTASALESGYGGPGGRGSVDNHARISYRWLGREFRCQTVAEGGRRVDQSPPGRGFFEVHVEAARPPHGCCTHEPLAAPVERTCVPALGLPFPRTLAADRLAAGAAWHHERHEHCGIAALPAPKARRRYALTRFRPALASSRLNRVASHAPPTHSFISSCCSCFGSAIASTNSA